MGWPKDSQYQEHVVAKVDADGSFTMDDGWSFGGIPDGCAVRPTVGATVRLYGRGTGYPVRGLAIDGEVAYYRTEAEDRAKHEADQAAREIEKTAAWERAGRAEYEEKFATLPPVFQKRLARFASNRADFAKQFGAYEMASCVDAVKIADALKTPEKVREFVALSWAEQIALVPGLDEGHSGNTFGMACRLARHYLTEPDLVWRDHAAISALVGCEEAGCPPVRA